MTDQPFRLILILGFATVTCLGLYYRIKSYTGEKLNRRQEGLFVLLGLRLIALIFFAGVIAYMIKPAWMAWSSMPLPVWLRWMGVGLALLGTILKTWTFHKLGRNLTDTVVTRTEHSLVTSGPYRWVRHPFYTSFTLDLLGISLLMENWFILVCGAAALVMIVIRTRTEEENLIAGFGDEYRAYIRRVGRFVPRLNKRA
jgi:protein-S-isoprenylcysteine O-methyltransferase Ste14